MKQQPFPGLVVAAVAAGVLSAALAQAPAASAPVPVPDAHSPACREALQALQAVEAQPVKASAAGSREREPRLLAARERASRACLGGPAGRPAPLTQTPQPVPPVSRPAPAPVPRQPMAGPPTSPVVTTPPAGSGLPLTILACDTTGCIASDGTRLNKVGPTLVGPHGACTLQGAVLRCPQ